MRRCRAVGLVFLANCLSHASGPAKAESPIASPAGAVQSNPAQNGPQPVIVLNPNSKVDEVLDALHADGANVKSFSADLKLTEDSLVFNTEVLRFGKIIFQAKPNGDATLHVVLDQKEISRKRTPEKREYLLDNGWLTNRDYDSKHEERIQMVPAGQKMNLFQLGKGPFPLPIGQDKKDVKAEFDVTIAPPDKDDPAGTIHLMLKPKPDSQWANTFISVEVWVDLKTNMPARVATQDKSNYKMTDLLNLKVNPAIDPKDLELPPLEKGWDSIDKPLK